jgi:hypothetical protein
VSDQSKIVIEAHKIRTATATAVLLHGSRRGPRDLRNPFSALIASFVLAAVLLIAIAAATMISKALDERRQQQQRRTVGNAAPTAIDQARSIADLPGPWRSAAPSAALT